MTPVNPVERLVPGPGATVQELLAARVAATPDATFVLADGRRWSYAAGLEEIRRVAGWLERCAGGPERVASFLPNRVEALWAWLGAVHAGATHVALHRAHRGEVLQDMVARSRAEVLVTDAEGLADLPDLTATSVRTLVVVDPGQAGPHEHRVRVVDWREIASAEPYDGRSRPADIAGIIYTSGTTGRSKAVPLKHNHLCRGAGWVTWSVGLDERDVIHMWLPLFHIAGQLDATLAAVVGGSAIALYPTFSGSRFWSQVHESGATVFIGFSNVLEILFASEDAPPGGGTLRAGIAGGIPPALHRSFEERFGVRLHDVYGMTEAEPLILPHPGEVVPPGSCGRPSPDFEIALLDADGHRVGAGGVGEIACRPRVPDVLMPGYEGDDDVTVRATRDLWFRTGDLGRCDEDGFLFFVDRRKHAIRRRGENISSWELERILDKHPAVAECCAVAVPSPLGEDDVKVVVARAAGQELEPPALREWCTSRMASFMLPRYVEIVDALPRSAVGKVAKHQLGHVGEGVWDAEEASAHAGVR